MSHNTDIWSSCCDVFWFFFFLIQLVLFPALGVMDGFLFCHGCFWGYESLFNILSSCLSLSSHQAILWWSRRMDVVGVWPSSWALWTPPKWKRNAGPECLVAEEWDGISAPLCPHGCLHEEGVVPGSTCYLRVVMLIQVITGPLSHQRGEADAWLMMHCCCEVGLWARSPVGPWTLMWEERNVAWLYSAMLIWGGNAHPSPPRSASSTITQQERGAGSPRWGGGSEPSHSRVASAGTLRCWDKGWLMHRVGTMRARWSLGLFSCWGLAREGQVWLLATQFLFCYFLFPKYIKKKSLKESIWHWCSGNF